jgi:futalosine hydrolase
MTNVVVVAATGLEIEPLTEFLSPYRSSATNQYVFGNLHVTICVTGVGMVNTAFTLGRLNGFDFSVAINAGVAGTFGAFRIGEVVSVPADCFSELGAEDDVNFLKIDELGFGRQHLALTARLQSPRAALLPETSGITVNTVHGNEESIRKIKDRWNAGIETMEGAAFVHAANFYQWNALQLRAISNVVEKRDRSKWDLPLALKNLNEVLIEIIKELNF